MQLGRWVLFLASALGAIAGDIPEPILPAGVGVNIHFVTGHQQDLNLIAAAGFKFIRMDFGWEATETSKDQYDWRSYDELLDNLDQRHLRAILILDYSHSLYEKAVTSPHPITSKPHKTTASPQQPESIAAFARWAAAAARHFRGRRVLWEIWNEPNGHFWSPAPDAGQYSRLALATAKAIRAAEPQATIIGPASAGFPWEFLETFLASGILEYLDAVSVHPYRDATRPPESAAADYARLRELIGRHAPKSLQNKIPILSGEWGYSSHSKGVSLETQGVFAARQQLVNLLESVPLSIWYDWKDDGPDPNENEHHFGTVLPDLKPKPAFLALQTLTHELSGYRIAHRIPAGKDEDFLLVCTNATGGQKIAAWTTAAAHAVSLALDPEDFNKPRTRGVTSDGKPFAPRTENNLLTMELNSAPQYLLVNSGPLPGSATQVKPSSPRLEPSK